MPDLDATTLLQQILDRIKGHEPDANHDRDREQIPRWRLNEEAAKRKTAEDALVALDAAHKAEIKRLREDASGQVARLATQHQEDLALVDRGISDPLGRSAVRMAWDQQPAEARGKSPIEWWDQQIGAHKAHLADPEKAAAPAVPRALAPYLPTPAAEPAPAQATPPERGVRRAAALSTDRGVSTAPPQSKEARAAKATSMAEFQKILAEDD